MIPSKLHESKKGNLKLKKIEIIYRQRRQNEMSNICIIKIMKIMEKMEHRQYLNK